MILIFVLRLLGRYFMQKAFETMDLGKSFPVIGSRYLDIGYRFKDRLNTTR